MFGDWGALVLQFAVTAVVILGLIGIVYWLVRRYSSAGIGRLGRGRVPRLAIMDAMSIDGRRRLVLVRRDNVEHLVLIGGPTDVVVEQAIQRPRRAKTAEQDPPQVSAAEEPVSAPVPPTSALPPPRARTLGAQNGAQPAASVAGNETFSFRRATPTPAPVATPPATVRARPFEEPAEVAAAASAARYVDLQRPTRIEAPAASLPEPTVEEREPLFPSLPTLDEPDASEEPAPGYTNGAGASHQASVDQSAVVRPLQPSPYAKPDSVAEETRGKLADLENEMARLLGEITQKRPS